jgi:hypothetical protein
MDMNVFVPPDLTNVVLEEAGLPPLTDEDARGSGQRHSSCTSQRTFPA